MTIDKNRIGKTRSGRFQYTSHYGWQLLSARNMPHGGMAAVDHGCRTRMQADRIPKIFGPFSDVLLDQFIDIPASSAEQSNDISRSVGSQARTNAETGILTNAFVPAWHGESGAALLQLRQSPFEGNHVHGKAVKGNYVHGKVVQQLRREFIRRIAAVMGNHVHGKAVKRNHVHGEMVESADGFLERSTYRVVELTQGPRIPGQQAGHQLLSKLDWAAIPRGLSGSNASHPFPEPAQGGH